MRKALTMPAWGAALFILVFASAAHAQATRTWVSGVGDDANPCSRTAPCKTFAGAISKTAAGGEINCIDPGGFGAVTITKSMTIDCAGTLGSILASGTNGINVAAGANDIVRIRNLSIQGIGTGLVGINFTSGAVLHVEKVNIMSFRAGNAAGIRFAPNAPAELYVADSVIADSGVGTTGGGLVVRPATSAGPARVTLLRAQLANNVIGLILDGSGGTGGIGATAKDIVASGNSLSGITATTTATGSTVILALDRCVASQNGTTAGQTGIVADGPFTTVRLSACTISGNLTGLSATNGGTLQSYKNNNIDGNVVAGTSPTVIQQN